MNKKKLLELNFYYFSQQIMRKIFQHFNSKQVQVNILLDYKLWSDVSPCFNTKLFKTLTEQSRSSWELSPKFRSGSGKKSVKTNFMIAQFPEK